MTSLNFDQISISIPTSFVFTGGSIPHTPTAVPVELPSDLLSDEDLMYSNIPSCWNVLSEEERTGITAWAEVYEAGSKTNILLKSKYYTIGASNCCDYCLTAVPMPDRCFEILVNNGTVSCTNVGLPVLIVDGIGLFANDSQTITGDCTIGTPNGEITLNVHVIERCLPMKIEEGEEYEEVLNKWVMITNDQPLGEGSFGEVKLGIDRKTRERVAVKVSLHCHDFKNYKREVRALHAVGNHSLFVRGLRGGITSLNTYLVIQYMAGGDLFHYVNRHLPLPEMEIKYIFKQLLEGAKFLHENNIVHRDIKLDNIMLSEDCPYPKVKYTDFGMAHFIEPSSEWPTCCGSVPYMAPEASLWSNQRHQLLERAKAVPGMHRQLTSAPFDVNGYGKPIDMWGLGVMLYVMLRGKFPYSNSNDTLVCLERILDNPVDFEQELSQFSREAIDLVKGLLDVDSSTRYTAETKNK
ncbi:kinase-like domain-containing protein [Syncephalis fuscata]|nr:kinase-like domain-containing protein [Syncephalis fuscata]